MQDFILNNYLWFKAFHLIAVISWMAGMLYLPRLFVYHVNAKKGSDLSETLKVMERRLLRFIMNPAMIGVWVFGLLMVFTPGVVDWSEFWPWVKAAAVIVMTWFHHWCAKRRKEFEVGENIRPARYFRMMNEIPTLMMVVIVLAVIARPF